MIKRLIVFAALALAACAVPPPDPGVGPPPQEQAVADQLLARGTQALIASENAYTLVAQGVATAVRTGIVPTAYYPMIKQINREVGEALDAGGRAQTGADKLRHADLVRSLTDRLRAFLPGGG